MMATPVRSGKVKDVYDQGDSFLFKFTDRISVFDKIIPTTIPDKGESLCRTSAFWFDVVSKTTDIPTHFISLKSKNEMIVKKFNVMPVVPDGYRSNYLVPLEFVVRYYAAGSLLDRIKSGQVRKEDLSLASEPKAGDPLPDPYLEITTKFEKFDRPLELEEASRISGLGKLELKDILEACMTIDRRMLSHVEKSGLIHADGKKEFAVDEERTPVIVDTFGTADEDRFWDKSSYDSGKLVELSKEAVRQYYRNSGYRDRLYKARSDGTKEPDIDPLPAEMVSSTSAIYRDLFEKMTGQRW
ncbi:MAG: phosphoribosylaminoimidazolesuccinocarboxamide synthase [Candidatus Thermoplasmatota archaeon]|jgi:phosphoribosylaminoimidazole-succinocarboxamide synthase|nr:phosphoribosylaminoimidazolesuccinocarboxamide synthase [Candidatus Thermoplasmatota archaeon]MCL5785692.1 phosphoribosylaminoimidazolesuccinocarboxamide synthase [Candidatus Thermoplasmatota archaeon]